MAQRGFGTQTFGSTPVPVFGTTLGAAVNPTPDFYTGQLGAGSNPSSARINLSGAYQFRGGDHVVIGASNSFTQGTTTPPDGGTIQEVLSASDYVVTGLNRKHAAGEYVILALPCSQIQIQTPAANTGSAYLAEDNTAGVNSPTLIAEIPKSSLLPSYTLPQGAGGNINAVETQKLWLDGTSGDKFTPSLLTI